MSGSGCQGIRAKWIDFGRLVRLYVEKHRSLTCVNCESVWCPCVDDCFTVSKSPSLSTELAAPSPNCTTYALSIATLFSRTHTHQTHNHLSLSIYLSHTHTHHTTISLSIYLSHTHTHTHTHTIQPSLSLSLSVTHTPNTQPSLSIYLSVTHTPVYNHLSLSLSLSCNTSVETDKAHDVSWTYREDIRRGDVQ